MRSHWPLPDLSFHRFRPLNSYAAAKKVSAAPHRGEANRPLRMQGKANAVGKKPKGKANAVGKQPKGKPNAVRQKTKPAEGNKRPKQEHQHARSPILKPVLRRQPHPPRYKANRPGGKTH